METTHPTIKIYDRFGRSTQAYHFRTLPEAKLFLAKLSNLVNGQTAKLFP